MIDSNDQTVTGRGSFLNYATGSSEQVGDMF